MRGATAFREYWTGLFQFQPTLLMRGATAKTLQDKINTIISIHAPHARSDSPYPPPLGAFLVFQSTLLMRGATIDLCLLIRDLGYFNPHPSCEERLLPSNFHEPSRKFQSTLLMRGATIIRSAPPLPLSFQSTLLMRGATQAPTTIP